ncbi:hypothetical protein RHECNPAF_4310075 [Rhizobium etli CNPAF512]|nr:hypothetical protein RHECNPAF_4310075 [Rhizobium etli CNPAF512]
MIFTQSSFPIISFLLGLEMSKRNRSGPQTSTTPSIHYPQTPPINPNPTTSCTTRPNPRISHPRTPPISTFLKRLSLAWPPKIEGHFHVHRSDVHHPAA